MKSLLLTKIAIFISFSDNVILKDVNKLVALIVTDFKLNLQRIIQFDVIHC